MSETHYTLGFLFNHQQTRVAMIKKERPAWQRGLWNGIGGKVNPGEVPHVAQLREFKEETGLRITNWVHRAVLFKIGQFHMDVYMAHVHDSVLDKVQTITDEEVKVLYLGEFIGQCIPGEKLPYEAVDNMQWLIPMILDTKVKPVTIEYMREAA